MSEVDTKEPRTSNRWPSWVVPACIGIMLVAAGILRAMGRVWWCKAGDLAIWSSDIWSMHQSQHFFDPYTFTHVLHGVMFYALLYLLLNRWMDPRRRLVIAVALESAWEILENSDFIIRKYREATISLDYFGDSVLNSISDILCCTAGYLAAMVLPSWVSAVGFFAVEAFLIWWIRDSLLINILMLTYPMESIKNWQLGAKPPI